MLLKYKSCLYFIMISVIFITADIALLGFNFNRLSTILITVFSLATFSTLLMLLNSFYSTKLTRLFLMLLSSAFVLAYFAEKINIYVTGMTFYEAFWDLLSISFIIESAKIYPGYCILLTVLFITSQILFFKLFILQIKEKIFVKSDRFIKVMLILVLFIFFIINSSLSKMVYSYSFYQLSKSDRTFHYLTKQPKKTDIYAKAGNKKNVVHIILESYADIFADNSEYPNLTPNLHKLKKQGIYLSNLEQLKYSEYSEAGNFIANRGHLMAIGGEQTPQDIGLTYVLKQAGYYNIFMRGAAKSAGGFKFSEIYSKEQGIDEFISYEYFKEKDKKNKKSNWGITDETLYNEALERYKELITKQKPFYLGLFTLDTHIDQEMSKMCQGNIKITGVELLDDIACTDYTLNYFINQLAKLPNFENTLIVIHADHMPYFADELVKNRDNKQFGLLLNTGKQAFVQNKTTYLFDIPETVINNLEIETNAKFLLGEDITTDFNRVQKTRRTDINYFPKLKLDDYSENMIYKIIINVVSFFIDDNYFDTLN